jgi:hypothetical protein
MSTTSAPTAPVRVGAFVDELDLDAGRAATCFPRAEAQVHLNIHRVSVVGADKRHVDLVIADLLCNHIHTRAEELEEIPDERRIADA